MNRSNFIQSLFVLAAAPKIIGELNVQKKSIGYTLSEVPVTVIKYIEPKTVYDLIYTEMAEDPGYMKYLLDCTVVEQDFEKYITRKSPLVKKCEQIGIDLSKPYKLEIGWFAIPGFYKSKEDMFKQNLMALKITQ